MHTFAPAVYLEENQCFCKICQKIKLPMGTGREVTQNTLYFYHSNITLHHQIFQGLAGPTVLVPQAATVMLGEASSSSKNMLHVSLL